MDARYVPDNPATQAQCLVVRPHRSLSVRGMMWLFVAYVGLLSIIGVGFLQAGMWMILPFAGLEAVVIGTIFYVLVYRHTNDHEVIIVEGDVLSIVKQHGRSRSRYEFQRYWTRVNLQCGGHQWYPSRLLLRSHGRTVELGAGIREEDRQALAERLREILSQRTQKDGFYG